jgi:hypothetical protein
VPSKSHFSITQASLITALTFVVGQLAAFVPAFGPDKQMLISAGSAAISAVFLIANSIHKLADSNVNPKQVEARAVEVAVNTARSELDRLNVPLVVDHAVASQMPDVPSLVTEKVRELLATMFGQVAPVPVAAPPALPPDHPLMTPEPMVPPVTP